MQRWLFLLLVYTLAGCSQLQGTARPAPAATGTPQEIQHDQTQRLVKIATVSMQVRGAPSDGEAAIRAKAVAAGANYYLILRNEETIVPGIWNVQAILYRP